MTLYRKYRPQLFAQVLGQPQVTDIISRSIVAGQPAHAYLFAGPRGTGKTSVARLLAKSLNCLQRAEHSAEPCNDCANCQAIGKGAFLDVVELDAASNRGIDEIRQLKEQVAVSPSMGRYKIYILDEAHMLTDAAFNALLKTLEEPPSNVVFVLCTTEAHKIPITIASRCQRLTFTRANVSQLVEQLGIVAKAEKIRIDKPALELLAVLADGGYRDAEMLLEQAIAMKSDQSKASGSITRADLEAQLGLANQQVVAHALEHLIAGRTADLVQLVEDFSHQGGNVRQLTDSLIDQYRLLLLVSVSPILGQQAAAEDVDRLTKLVQQTNQEQILRVTQKLLEARQQLQHYQGHHQALALETALLETAQSVIGQPDSQAATIMGASQTAKQVPADKAAKTPPPPVVSARSAKDPVEDSQPGKSVAGEIEALPNPASHSTDQPAEDPVTVAPQPAPGDLTEMWQRILEVIKPQSRSVEALLRDCLPLSFDGTILVLQFWYVFHKNKLDIDKNRTLVEEAASQVVGGPVKVQSQLGDKKTKPKRQPMTEKDIKNISDIDGSQEENLVDAAVDIFGGQIIE